MVVSALQIAEVAKRILSNLKIDQTNITSAVSDVVVQGVPYSSTSSDSGASKAIFDAKQNLPSLLTDLNEFETSLNGQATPEQKRLLLEMIDTLRTDNGLTNSQKRDLVDLVGEFAVKKDEKETEGKEQAKQIDPSKDTNPSVRFRHFAGKILEREILDRSGPIGLIAGFIKVANPEGKYGDEEKVGLATVLQHGVGNVLNEKFMEILEARLNGKGETSCDGLDSAQQSCLKVATFVAKGINFLPEWALEFLPMSNQFLNMLHPVLHKIPVLGYVYSWAFPVLASGTSLLGKFYIEATGLKTALKDMKPKPKAADGSVAIS